MKIEYPSVLIGIVIVLILLFALMQFGGLEYTWKSENMSVPRFYQWQSNA
jgi:hypothetical protein